MGVREQTALLSEEAEDLADFLSRACELRGKGVVRASREAGLSANTISSFIRGKRRPSLRSVTKLAAYFGVAESDLRRLGGLPVSSDTVGEYRELGPRIGGIARVLTAEEKRKWLEYGEMLLLKRQREMMEESNAEVEGEAD